MTSAIKTTLAAIAALGLTTGIALAQTPEFPAVDANADSAISWEELAAAWPDMTQEQFTTADADASGGLSAEEYAALAAQ